MHATPDQRPATAAAVPYRPAAGATRPWRAAVVTLTATIVVAGLAAMAVVTQVPFSTVSRDPATALRGPFVTGYLSYLGACLWCAAAAVALFAWAISREDGGNSGGGGTRPRFLLLAGLLTALLGADDLFMLHDGLVPYVVGDVEHALLAAYAVAALAIFLTHNQDVRHRTDIVLLAAALACFAASSMFDMGVIRPGESRRHLFEDGLKFLGIANWAAWLMLASAAAVRTRRVKTDTQATDARSAGPAEAGSAARRATWPTRAGLLLAGVALFITVAGGVGQWLRHARGVQRSFGFIHQFGPDEEANLASWFASAVMLLCAALMAGIGGREACGWARRRWWGLAGLFVVMSADETAQLHEMSIGPLRSLLGARGMLYFTWVVPGVLLALLVAAVSLRFLQRLPRRACGLFLAAGATYLAGALGVEMAGGWYAEAYGFDALGYAMLSLAEEALELAGLVLFAYALCDHADGGAETGAGDARAPARIAGLAAADRPPASHP